MDTAIIELCIALLAGTFGVGIMVGLVFYYRGYHRQRRKD